MDKLKEVMPMVFVNVASVLVIGLAAALVAQLPFLRGSEVILGVVGGAFGFERMKAQISKLPGVKKKAKKRAPRKAKKK